MFKSIAIKENNDAAGAKFSGTSTRLSIWSRLISIAAVFSMVVNVDAQNVLRTFDLGRGHRGEPGGILEHNGTLYTGAQDSAIKLWDVSNGAYIRDVRGHTDWVHAFAVIDNWLFSGGRDNTVKQWTIGTFTQVRSMNTDFGGWVMCMIAHNRAIYVGTIGGVIFQFNPDTGAETRRFTGHTSTVRGIMIHNNLMFSASEDYTARRWDLSLTNPTPTTLGGSNWANSIEKTATKFYVSGHGGWVAGGGARINEYALDGTFLRQMSFPSWDTIGSCTIRDDQMVISYNGVMKVFNVTTGNWIRDIFNVGAGTRAGVDSFYSFGASIRRWNWADFSIMWATIPNYGWTSTVSDGSSLWGGRTNGEIWQFNIATGELLRVLTGHTGSVNILRISGNSLFSSSQDSTSKQWSLATGSFVRTYTGHSQDVVGMGIVGNHLITSGFYDMTIRVWNMNNGALVRTITSVAPGGRVYAMHAAANFAVVGIGELSGDVNPRVYDWTNGTHFHTFTGHASASFQVFLREMPNGDVQLFTSDWSTVRQFDVRRRQLIRTFFAPSAICGLCVAQNMVFGASCYYGVTSLRQWDITTGNLVRSIAGASTSGSASISSFGSSIFVSDFDGALRQYNIPELVVNSATTPTPDVVVDPVIEPTTTVEPETTPGVEPESNSTGRVGASESSALLNNGVVIPVAASGVFIGAVLAFAAIRNRHNQMKRFSDTATVTSTDMTSMSTSTTTTTYTQQLPNITSITGLVGGNSEMTSAAGATVNQTAVTQTFEVSIPVFLEMRWGLDFRQEDFIAKGGGGSIYRATCLELDLADRSKNQPLAVKNVAEALETMDEKVRTAFFQEVSLMHRFRDHPNFIRLFAYSTRPVTMVMKLYELGDLVHFIAGRGATVKRGIPYTKFAMVSLMHQFASAIAHMHENGVVHCDVKPANVLLDTDANGGLVAVLTDFGISRIVDKTAMKVQAFNVADLRGASLAYASPESMERFRKRLTETDGRVWMAADTYALAISALQMMARTTPWRK